MENEKNLYINIWDYDNIKTPFQFHVAGRGTGKTYSALRGLVVEKRHITNDANMFLFMRRTDKELSLLLDDEKRGESDANPFKSINNDYNTNYGIFKIKDGLAGVYNRELDENGKLKRAGSPVGYACALSTIASFRGMNFEDISFILYDEFIPESHIRKIKNEHDALLNAYETINRGRELKGREPVKLWCLANSNDIYNPIFTGLGFVRDCERMINKGQEHKYLYERSTAIHIYNTKEEYKEQKGKTALYQFAKGTRFSEMSLENKFAYNDFSDIAHRDLRGYVPICSLDNGYLYKKKGSNEYYFCYAQNKCRNFSTKTETDIRNFMRSIGSSLIQIATKHLIIYESYELKSLLLDLLF